jgi:hypothetical protein
VTRWLSDQVTSDQVTSEKDDERYYRSYNFKCKIQRGRCTVATHSNILCDSLLQWPSTKHKDIVISVWTKFGKFMLLTWTTVCSLLTRWKTFRFIRVHTRRKNKKYCILKSSSINTIKTKYRVSFKLNWRRSKARRVQLVLYKEKMKMTEFWLIHVWRPSWISPPFWFYFTYFISPKHNFNQIYMHWKKKCNRHTYYSVLCTGTQ